jgi:hypothetical protein
VSATSAAAARVKLARNRQHRELVLAAQVEQLPAGHEHDELGGLLQERGDERRRFDHLLEVVEHEQELLPVQARAEAGDRICAEVADTTADAIAVCTVSASRTPSNGTKTAPL